MHEEELKKYFNVYTDCWKLFRKYSNPNGTDEFWEALMDEVHLIHENHGKTEFSKAIILQTVDEIEKLYKSGIDTK